MIKNYFDPKINKTVFNEISEEEFLKLWQVPCKSTHNQRREWAQNGQYQFSIDRKTVHIKADVFNLEVETEFIRKDLYGHHYVSDIESCIKKIDGKPFMESKYHELIAHDEYSVLNVIPDDDYNRLLEEALEKEYGYIS